MAPEQARGQTADKRADIWAFGCVLYELLTAHRAFEGETVADVLASVVAREPRYERLEGVPLRLRASDPNSAFPLQWLSLDATIVPTQLAPTDWSNPRISPDGQRGDGYLRRQADRCENLRMGS